MNKTKISLVILLVVITIITCIKPVYPHEQFLQHAGTLLLVIPLLVDLSVIRGLVIILSTSEPLQMKRLLVEGKDTNIFSNYQILFSNNVH